MLFKLMPMGSAVAYSDRVVSCQEAIEERMEGRQHILVFDRGTRGGPSFSPWGSLSRRWNAG